MLGQIAKWCAKLGAKTLFKKGVSTELKTLSLEIGKNCYRKGKNMLLGYPSCEHLKLKIKVLKKPSNLTWQIT